MAKTELKTKKTEVSVEDFLNSIEDEKVLADCLKISSIMEKATGAKPKMWGSNIVGFGKRLLKYESGRELDWMEIAFSPRKQNITLYLTDDNERNRELLDKLGKHKTGKGCLYIKKLSDVDESVLEKLIVKSVEDLKKV
ncbi:MAG: DUF1801 domain-containing protein [Pyrinomonadaceae bacterium]|nr:DUF1801 domain-containing protein [Pyrinomonadaceae bacterium]